MISVVLLLVAFSVDWAKTYKPVNYKYTAFGNKQFRGYGCPKGSFGYYNRSGVGAGYDPVRESGVEWKSDHFEQSKCVECKTITKDFIYAYFRQFVYSTPETVSVNDTEMEKVCNGGGANVEFTTSPGGPLYDQSVYPEVTGCYWNSKKKTCGATSCPYKAAIETCKGNWTNGKCVKRKGNTCLAHDYIAYLPTTYSAGTYGGDIWEPDASSGCTAVGYHVINSQQEPYTTPPCTEGGGWISCDKLGDYYKTVKDGDNPSSVKYEKFSKEDVKQCNWLCTHSPYFGPSYPTYDFTIGNRRACNKVYGCLYSDWHSDLNNFPENQSCSYWAIWAFILFLVLLILFIIAIIVVIVILVIKLCGKKTTKVEDGAAAQSKSASPAAAPVDSSPPPPSGPYVVIKLGKQEKQTKKVQSSQWGESIVFTGLGAEDDDVEIELHADSGALLGNVNIRIPEYVNAKKRATLTLKSGDADIGVLETDIEIQVQEEPEVKITGVFYVDKFTKA